MKGGFLEPQQPHATAPRTTRTRRSYLKLLTALLVAALYARFFYVSTPNERSIPVEIDSEV